MNRRRAARDASAFATLLVLFAGGLSGTAQAAVPTVTIDDPTVTETTGTPTSATFTITLSAATTDPVSVSYATVNGGASAPGDYTSATGTATFDPGETSKPVTVTVIGDALDEDAETFSLQLTTPTNAAFGDGIGVATIIDDDDAPAFSVSDASIVEGTGANKFLQFTVSLSAATSRFTAVDYETLEGTAKEIVSTGTTTTGDYTAKSGTLSFSPGTTSQTISVSVRADSEDETDETLTLHLKPTPVVSATIADDSGLGTIIDDDGPSVSISDVAVPAEGATGTTTPAVLTVTLSAASPQPVTVSYATANDSALAGQDYAALPANQTLTIPAGDTTATITTQVTGDDLDENDEKYRVTLTNPVNASLVDGVGVVTITNDDAAPRVSVSPVTITEGTGGTTNATLTVTLSAPSGRTILGGYATQDETAKAGVDYQQAAELLTYNPGETSKTISIPIAPDNEIEEDETFKVFVFNAAAGADGVSPVAVKITDDDLNDSNMPQLSVSDAVVKTEGDAGTTQQAVFTVSMDRPLARAVTVEYATTPGTATAPEDFGATGGKLTFAAGERTKQVSVTTVGDDLLEFNDDFRVVLANPVNAKPLDGTGLGIITDDDVGGGTLGIGLRSAALPVERIRLRDLLCAPRPGKRAKLPRCAGVRAAWTVATPGTIDVTVVGLKPSKKPAAGKPAPTPKVVYMFRATRKLSRAGSGTFRAKRAPGRTTERLVKTLRTSKVTTVRVTLGFNNRFGGRQETTEVLRLAG